MRKAAVARNAAVLRYRRAAAPGLLGAYPTRFIEIWHVDAWQIAIAYKAGHVVACPIRPDGRTPAAGNFLFIEQSKPAWWPIVRAAITGGSDDCGGSDA